ncbi:MAG: isoprenylcysteine carboxylmethyltransferase family protein [Candidatus Woesearchaeota archaeon]|nr:MAG: isoprenylcysteine carboxylmethyltransferase family protein [Candidatus Woesearchaeota archaeon]
MPYSFFKRHPKNLIFRIMLLILAIIPFLFFKEFYKHIYAHFTGSIISIVIVHQWHIVVINIIIFLSFLIPLSYRKKFDWKNYGLVAAFFVSLFIEMYGVPLTIFFLSKSFVGSNVVLPTSFFSFEFLGVTIAMSLAMIYATVLMIIGMVLILIGWVTLYKNIEKEEIVTSGIYSFSRHPQYLGFLFIVIGWLIGWPTLLMIIFAPILVYKYIQVSITEEKEMSGNKKYQEYIKNVPFFI